MSPFSVQANASVAPPNITDATINPHILPYSSGLYPINTTFPDSYQETCSSTPSLVNILPPNYKNVPTELLEAGKDHQNLLLAPHLVGIATSTV